MAITLEPQTDAIIGLEEYLDFVDREVDMDDRDSVLDSSPQLKRLANNQTFLIERINDELKNLAEFQRSNKHTAQTLILGTNDRFFVRANVWMPPSPTTHHRAMEDDVLSYMQPHDHNFDLLTVGYAGPGYDTDIYEYDRDKVDGYIGEQVEIRPLETTRLNPGRILFFRANQDIHSQHHPAELSISINLIGAKPDTAFREQFHFDVDEGVITRYVDTRTTARGILFKLAAELGDGRTCDLLEQVAGSHPANRSRAQAYEAMRALRPSEQEAICARAATDPSPVVSRWARGLLDTPL